VFKDVEGRELERVIRDSTEGAKLYAQEKEIDYETIDILEEDLSVTDTSPVNTASAVNTTTKARKPRADKGQSRKEKVKVEGNVDNKSKKVVNRKHPEYFVFYDGNLTPALSREKAIGVIDEDNQSNPRVIMGHEITFTRSVKFHIGGII